MDYLKTLKTETIEGLEVLYQCGHDEFYTIKDLAYDSCFELSQEKLNGNSCRLGKHGYYEPEFWVTPKFFMGEYMKPRVLALRKLFKGESAAYILHCTVRKNGITLVEKFGVGGMIYEVGDEHLMLESVYFEELISESLEEAKQVIKSLCA